MLKVDNYEKEYHLGSFFEYAHERDGLGHASKSKVIPHQKWIFII
jgi:hypothetical protein